MSLINALCEAKFYKKISNNRVKCQLCPQVCLIKSGDTGYCLIRKNLNGKLYAIGYSRVSSVHLDPIEKKPLRNFHPGSTVLSIGGVGCNLRCPWCQSANLTQPFNTPSSLVGDILIDQLTEPLLPMQVVELTRHYAQEKCVGVAYTYNEPFISYEYMKDIAEFVKNAGMLNVVVTNGYVMEQPLREILPLIDAMNIDIKGFSESFYRRLNGHIRPVMKTAELAKAFCHVEITNLIIPGMNDKQEDFEKLADWISTSLGKETPLHFLRYFPSHKMTTLPTPLETLIAAREIAREKLDFVYLENV